MSEDNEQPLPSSGNVTNEELEALVAGIDRSRIIDLVKHSSHLKQVFRGFRPSRLPWSQVPSRLAREVESNPSGFEDFVRMWIGSNKELLDEVADISTEQLKEGLAELLARHGIENRLQVLWALRFDDREEVQEALRAGLVEEIRGEASRLLSQAEQHTLALALETARVQIAELQDRLVEAESDLEDSHRLAQHKKEQLERSQEEKENLRKERQKLSIQVEEQTHRLEALTAEQNRVEEQLSEERAKTEELRRSVRDLKETLHAQIASSRQEETQQELNEALLRLEKERKEASELRLRLSKLTQQLEDAYMKRDAEQMRSDELEQELQRLKYDKGVIIEEKRQLTDRIEELHEEVRDAREQLQERTVDGARLSWDELDGYWIKERESIRDQLHTLVNVIQDQRGVSPAPVSKWEMWTEWMEVEKSLLQGILATLEEADEGSVGALKQAQELLALRWYLLEYTRQAILSKL